MQDGLTISADRECNGTITGTLKYLSEECDITTTWGAGNFMALKFANTDPRSTSVKVGMDPSAGSGLVEIIDDPDQNGIFKVTNKDTQKFVIVQTDNNGHTTRQEYSLAGLTCLAE